MLLECHTSKLDCLSAEELSKDEVVDLKEGFTLQDLQNKDEGAVFEIDTDNFKQTKDDLSNQTFDGAEVCENILHINDQDADECDKEDASMFSLLEQRMEDVTTAMDGGVLKRMLRPGAGPIAPLGSLVHVHYNAYQEDDEEPFDSSRLRKDVEKFRLGHLGTVEGIHVAVSTMKKGERSQFIFKPDYYYGHMGCPPRIPPDCTVLFDIELISFMERDCVDDFYHLTEAIHSPHSSEGKYRYSIYNRRELQIRMEVASSWPDHLPTLSVAKASKLSLLVKHHILTIDEEERKKLTFAFVCQVSKLEREDGNQRFSNLSYYGALNKYKHAAKILEDYCLKNEQEEIGQKKYLLMTYLNIALCCVRLKQCGHAIAYSNKVLHMDPNNVKALYRKALALHSKGELLDARETYKRVVNLGGINRDVFKRLEKLDEDMKKFKMQDVSYKNMCMNMFKTGQGDASESDVCPPSQPSDSPPEVEECSPAFRKIVFERLTEFKKDKDMAEIPFPEGGLTVSEISCFLEVSNSLGLHTQRKGTGNSARMIFVKPRNLLDV